jgi:hypothetical protein
VCGRYQRRSDQQAIAEAFAIRNMDALTLETDLELAPKFLKALAMSQS